jgi:hypothetical protein
MCNNIRKRIRNGLNSNVCARTSDKVSRIGVRGNSEREATRRTFRLRETDRKLGAAFESFIEKYDESTN